MTEHRNSHGAPKGRYGTLDVPLSVWQVADAAALTAGLLAEFKPPRGPIVAVDVPGWEAIPRAARHALILTRDRSAASARLAALPGTKQGLARIQPVGESSLATRLAAVNGATGLVIASAWLLACTGALAAAANALRPDGVLAITGQGMADQTRLARLTRPRVEAVSAADGPGESDDAEEAPAAFRLVFAGHIVAAPPRVFDAAAGAAEARHADRSACPAMARHFDVVLWRKARSTEAGDARG
jgi:hypothetical protein